MFRVFRSKQGQEVEAYRFDGTENIVVGTFFYYEQNAPRLSIKNGDVRFIVSPGAWIIRVPQGFISLSDAVFKQLFESIFSCSD